MRPTGERRETVTMRDSGRGGETAGRRGSHPRTPLATDRRWNLGSGDAFAAPFAEGADFVGFDGTYFRGRQETASFHKSSAGRSWRRS